DITRPVGHRPAAQRCGPAIPGPVGGYNAQPVRAERLFEVSEVQPSDRRAVAERDTGPAGVADIRIGKLSAITQNDQCVDHESPPVDRARTAAISRTGQAARPAGTFPQSKRIETH